LPFCH
jgi:hypothetical protein